jgi:outer membrane protein
MKHLSYVLAFSLLCMTTSAFAEVLIGKVDIQKVLITVDQGKKVRDQLKKEFDKKQGELKNEEEKIRKKQQDYEKQSLVMNEKTKATKEKEIQQTIMEFQNKSMEYQRTIQEMENNLKKPILENIKGIVDEVSKSAGVDVTFEMSSTPVVYAKKDKDLTDEVIKAYNKKYK